jgi:hypothetical protein
VIRLDEKAAVTKLSPPNSSPLTPNPKALSFTQDILPILSKAGCNLGACHAKASGQAGFKLSIFAYDPKGDYMELVKDSRGRRVFPALPEDSLLLQKAVVRVQHEGGQRFEPDSASAKTIADWIRQGMPYETPGQPALTGIDVTPAEKTYRKNERARLRSRPNTAMARAAMSPRSRTTFPRRNPSPPWMKRVACRPPARAARR